MFRADVNIFHSTAQMTKVNVYLDGRFSYCMLLEAGESIPADGSGITYRVIA